MFNKLTDNYICRVLLLGLTGAALFACAQQQVVKTFQEDLSDALQVRVSIPYAINLISVDGRNFDSLLRSAEAQYYFSPGYHEIELRYEEVWELDGDDHSVVQSEVVRQEWNLLPGAEYELIVPTAKTLDQSQQISQSFQPWIKLIKQAELDSPELKQALQESPDSQQLRELKRWWDRSGENDRSKFIDWIKTKNKP